MSWYDASKEALENSWFNQIRGNLFPRYNLPGGRGRWFNTLHGEVPSPITQGEEIVVPTFEIVTNPTIKLSEIKARRFYIVDRAQIQAKAAIQAEEDASIFDAINMAVYAQQQMETTSLQNKGNVYPTIRTIRS
jgi:hypothetical protein